MCYKATLINSFDGGINKKIRGIKKNPEIDSCTHKVKGKINGHLKSGRKGWPLE